MQISRARWPQNPVSQTQRPYPKATTQLRCNHLTDTGAPDDERAQWQSQGVEDGHGHQRRTTAVIALRDFRLLIGAFVLAATVALKGGVLASSNPLELNGGSCLAMAGKGCVALAVDRRFGLEGQLVSTEAKRVLKVWACRGSGVCVRERKESIKVFSW